MNKLVIAKALRKSFNAIQSELLTQSYMSDEYLVEQVREMQLQHAEFRRMADDLKKNSLEDYEKLLGL